MRQGGLRSASAIVMAALLLSGCKTDTGSTAATTPATPTTAATSEGVYPSRPSEALTSSDVQQILAQAIEEATARRLPATIAVVDRVGNVLAVFNMTGARPTAITRAAPNGDSSDVQNLTVPAPAAAITKALTAAYLSSSGNAFSTRTASQIVQEHFPPAPSTVGLESGPLFGVQFSQLPCSDLNTRVDQGLIGPKRSPLGMAADPGGLPLYKNGVVVGGIGIMADGDYGYDASTLDIDRDDEEYIALAGTLGYAAPDAIQAGRISVDGTLLRFSDAEISGLQASGAPRPFATLSGTVGSLIAVRGYNNAVVTDGVAYGTETSGVRRATRTEFSDVDAFLLTDGRGSARFPIRAGTEASAALSAAEVRAILEEAFAVIKRARAQIRKPLDSRAEVTVSVVDSNGVVLGQVRSPDAPVFGIDVSLQKARTAAFFSNANAASDLQGTNDSNVTRYLTAYRAFLSNQSQLTGEKAISARWIGLLARPYFPDGQVDRPNGPLSRPIGQFSPFSTGLQSALVLRNLAAHLAYVGGAAPSDTDGRCTALPLNTAGVNRLQNGIQIFPGAVPIYRGSTLIGAIGTSGDGIDQDDMISFLGLSNASARLNGVGNAASSLRASNILFPQAGNASLPYAQCPFAPFLDSAAQNVCQGK
ncbi:MAG: heme-binding protein [Chakrabartia godavariana]